MKIKNFIAIAVAVIMLPIMMFAADKGGMVPIINKNNELVGWKQFTKDTSGKTIYKFYSADGKRVLRRVVGTPVKSGGKTTHIKMVVEEVKDGKLTVVQTKNVPYNAAKFKVAETKGAKLDADAIARYNALVKSGKVAKVTFTTPKVATKGTEEGGETEEPKSPTTTETTALAALNSALAEADTQNGLPEGDGY